MKKTDREIAYDFIQELSCGEWPEEMMNKDADSLCKLFEEIRQDEAKSIILFLSSKVGYDILCGKHRNEI